jgi:hypothetical protein
MTNKRLDITTVIGRFVYGSLYKPYTKDAAGNPLTFKDGSPRSEYRVGLAIRKGQEQHWTQTPWGQLIYQFAEQNFLNGQCQSPYFSWKITDGDATLARTPNAKRPCDKEGYPGHWVLSWSNSIPPQVCDTSGMKLLEVDRVKPGDYIQIHGNIAANKSDKTPGIYFNLVFVAFAGVGARIHAGPDITQVQWGGALPPEAQPINSAPTIAPFGTPSGMPPVFTPPVLPAVTSQVQMAPSVMPAHLATHVTNVQPYPNILNAAPSAPSIPMPTPAAAPVRKMTDKAAGFTYEQFIAVGHTDESLIREGFMVMA